MKIDEAIVRYRLRYDTAPTHLLLDSDGVEDVLKQLGVEKLPSFIHGLRVVEIIDGKSCVATIEPL